jgi:hypothetical protein
MARATHKRGEYTYHILKILLKHPEGMAAKNVLAELPRRMVPTSFEAKDYPNRPGVRRFDKMARFSTIVPVQAAWITKIKGIWTLTDRGQGILKTLNDPEKLGKEMHRLWIAWKETHPREHDEKEKPIRVVSSRVTGGGEVSVPGWKDFIPPVIFRLHEMAINSDKPQEFEQAVMILFRMLGYQVENYGQGKGRQPDGIATAREFRYAILFDAKSSREGYSLGTDDRAIIEYIQTHKKRLVKDGFEKLYFVLISSSFRGDSKIALQRIRQQTGVQSVVLFTAQQALQLLAHHIGDPLTVDLENLEMLFMSSGPIADELSDFLEQGSAP